MKAKALLLFYWLLVYSIDDCEAQKVDSISLTLPQCRLHSCLSNLCRDVIQSNKQYYSRESYFYSLTFKKGTKDDYISLNATRIGNARFFDYAGMSAIDSMPILLRGDFIQVTIFKKIRRPEFKIKLQRINEADEILIVSEPSLQGLYQQCTGRRIYLEVYTKGKIAGYGMKFPNSP